MSSMAFCLGVQTSPSFCTKMHSPRCKTNQSPSVKRQEVPRHARNVMVTCAGVSNEVILRRSANYKPTIWDYDLIQTLKSEYAEAKKEEPHARRIKKLKEDVRMMLEKSLSPLDKLEMIDTLERLGLTYHFEEEIKKILNCINKNGYQHQQATRTEKDLYAVALEFRLLRQHGYFVHQEVFNHFMDGHGNFKACLCDDMKGILFLYEASFLAVEGEGILEEAREFTTRNLEEHVKLQNKDDYLSMLVRHALELPLHWRMPRSEAWWFINVYENKQDRNPIFLELAKLDFNTVQATLQEDLKCASRWWKCTGFGEKLEFARDGVLENFTWLAGMKFEPQFADFRRGVLKPTALITTVDDVYDIYGSLDELELLTDAIVRWDINAVDQLPEYMKVYFLVLYNSTNDMVFEILRDQGFNVLAYVKKVRADLCESYMKEARWYYSGYSPTLEEYLDYAWIPVGSPLMLVYAYYFLSEPMTKEVAEFLKDYPNIVKWSSLIVRLANDLGTSSDEMERGDVRKSIQLYMNETGASEEEAREHIRYLIREAWKKINGERFANTIFSETFVDAAMNIARVGQYVYLHGDGHAGQHIDHHCRLTSLFVQPIPLTAKERLNSIAQEYSLSANDN